MAQLGGGGLTVGPRWLLLGRLQRAGLLGVELLRTGTPKRVDELQAERRLLLDKRLKLFECE